MGNRQRCFQTLLHIRVGRDLIDGRFAIPGDDHLRGDSQAPLSRDTGCTVHDEIAARSRLG